MKGLSRTEIFRTDASLQQVTRIKRIWSLWNYFLILMISIHCLKGIQCRINNSYLENELPLIIVCHLKNLIKIYSSSLGASDHLYFAELVIAIRNMQRVENYFLVLKSWCVKHGCMERTWNDSHFECLLWTNLSSNPLHVSSLLGQI